MTTCRCEVIGIAAVLALLFAADAQAQWSTPLGGRLTIQVNGAGQNPGGDVSFEGTSSFVLYEEPAVTARRQTIKGTGGGLVEFGVSYHVTKRVALGLSHTSSLKTVGDAALTGTLPDPDVFDRPRSATLTVPGLNHEQDATHLSAIFTIPFVENLDFAFTIGPSFLRVKQDFVRTPTLASFSDPLQSTITLTGVTIVRATKSVVGFNIGGEATYMLMRNVGVGAMLRYVRGSVDFDVEDGQNVNLKAGNAQLGAGIRLKF